MIDVTRETEIGLGRKVREIVTLTPEEPRFAHICVNLSDHEDENIFSLISLVTRAMAKEHAGHMPIDRTEITQLLSDITQNAKSYEHAIELLSCYVTISEEF